MGNWNKAIDPGVETLIQKWYNHQYGPITEGCQGDSSGRGDEWDDDIDNVDGVDSL